MRILSKEPIFVLTCSQFACKFGFVKVPQRTNKRELPLGKILKLFYILYLRILSKATIVDQVNCGVLEERRGGEM